MSSIEFSLSEQIYNQSGSVESNCNGITFINIGTDIVSVLSNPIIPGASFTPPCNVGEKDVTRYICQFVGAIGQTQKLLVLRKNYNNR